MGTFQKGILGGFSGKVGTVIGGNWKGIDYMRSKGSNGNKNPTLPQVSQQFKFALCIRFLQTMSGLVRLVLKTLRYKKPALTVPLVTCCKMQLLACTPPLTLCLAMY